MKQTYISSPLNYTGGKGRILGQILPLFPADIDIFVDLFCGGCNVGINVEADRVVYNDTLKPLIGLFRTFKRRRPESVLRDVHRIIDEFGLSRTSEFGYAEYGENSSDGVARYNREGFNRMRDELNSCPRRNGRYYILLYTLIVYAFNNQIRFNDRGEFNLPVGKRDFNRSMEEKLMRFMESLQNQNCEFRNRTFRNFDFSELTENSLVYCDPPYLITTATYNENGGWGEKDEIRLLKTLDGLDARNIRFALSNVISHEGKENVILRDWIEANEWHVHEIRRDYSSCNYQKKPNEGLSREVLITNY